jgi:hypothetical protein
MTRRETVKELERDRKGIVREIGGGYAKRKREIER